MHTFHICIVPVMLSLLSWPRYEHVCECVSGDTLHSMVPLYGVYMSTSPSDSTLYTCEVCNETFNTQQEIERHNKEKHIETAGQKE